MKKYFITAFALLCVAITACKKSTQNPKPINTEPTCKLTSILLGAGGTAPGTENLTYDAQGRLVKDSIGTQPYNFSYAGNKITITTGNIVIELTLENGRVINYSDNTGATEPIAYNSDGYISTVSYYQDGALFATDARTYTNGNLTGFKQTPGPGNPSGSTLSETFSYDATKTATSFYIANPMYYTVPFYIPGLYGKEPKGLLISFSGTTDYLNSPTDETNHDFTYEQDQATGNYSTVTQHLTGTRHFAGNTINVDQTTIFKLTYVCDK